MPTSRQVCEHQAEDYSRAAAQTDDAVFRKMLLMLALQWRLAAQEDQSTGNEVAARSSARDAAWTEAAVALGVDAVD